MEPADRLPRDLSLDELTFEVLLRDSRVMAERDSLPSTSAHPHLPAAPMARVVIDVPDRTRELVVGLGSYGV